MSESSEPRQLQRRMIEAGKLLERSKAKRANLAREKRRIEITLKELATPSPTIYKSIGKMFLAVGGQDEVEAELRKRLETIEVETATVTRQEQQFQTALESAQHDLIALFQAQQQQQQQASEGASSSASAAPAQ